MRPLIMLLKIDLLRPQMLGGVKGEAHELLPNLIVIFDTNS